MVALLALAAWSGSLNAQGACAAPSTPGGARFNAELSFVTGVLELRNGDVLVTDVLQHQLLLLEDPVARVGRQIGRTGEGPGEYGAPRWLFALGGDSSLVTDAQSRRWLVLDGTRIVETVPASERLPRILGPDLKGADRLGRVLQVLFDWRKQIAGESDSAYVVLANRATEALDTVTRIFHPARPTSEVRFPHTEVRYWMSNPLLVKEQAVLFPDGWVAIARSNPYRVDWITPSGEQRIGAPLPVARIRVDDDEKRAAAARVSYPDRGVHFEPHHFLAWPSTLPPFTNDALFAAPDGRLLVRRMPSARDTMTVYDVIDRTSTLVGKVELAENQQIIGFGSESVYIVCKDEVDVPILLRQRWTGLVQRR